MNFRENFKKILKNNFIDIYSNKNICFKILEETLKYIHYNLFIPILEICQKFLNIIKQKLTSGILKNKFQLFIGEIIIFVYFLLLSLNNNFC